MSRRPNHNGLPSPLRGGPGWGCRHAGPDFPHTGSPKPPQRPKSGAGTPTSGSSPQGGGERCSTDSGSCLGRSASSARARMRRLATPGVRTTTASPPPCGEGQGGGAGTPILSSPEPDRQECLNVRSKAPAPPPPAPPRKGEESGAKPMQVDARAIVLFCPSGDLKAGDIRRSNHNNLPSPSRQGDRKGRPAASKAPPHCVIPNRRSGTRAPETQVRQGPAPAAARNTDFASGAPE